MICGRCGREASCFTEVYDPSDGKLTSYRFCSGCQAALSALVSGFVSGAVAEPGRGRVVCPVCGAEVRDTIGYDDVKDTGDFHCQHCQCEFRIGILEGGRLWQE